MTDSDPTGPSGFDGPGSVTDARDLHATVTRLTASPLLYVGAITVVVSTEIASWLALSGFRQVLAVFPLALALLYGQLALVVLYRRSRPGSGPTGC